jgi:hypothetical protein
MRCFNFVCWSLCVLLCGGLCGQDKIYTFCIVYAFFFQVLFCYFFLSAQEKVTQGYDSNSNIVYIKQTAISNNYTGSWGSMQIESPPGMNGMNDASRESAEIKYTA